VRIGANALVLHCER